jgi:hypothetical protein
MMVTSMQPPIHLLFIHNNFPGQFLHLLKYLRRSPRIAITFISADNNNRVRGVRLLTYPEPRGDHWTCLQARGLAVHRIIARLLKGGEHFDAVLAHSPSGDALYVRSVLPRTPFLALPEF